MLSSINGFTKQAIRVLQITHKPSNYEFRHIALSTGIGIIIIGLIGLTISMIAYFARG